MSFYGDCVPDALTDPGSAAPFPCDFGSINEPERHEYVTYSLESPSRGIVALCPGVEDGESKVRLGKT